MGTLKVEAPRRRNVVRDLLRMLLPGLLLLAGLMVAHFHLTLEQASQLNLQQARTTTSLTRQLMHNRISEMTADVRILAEYVANRPPSDIYNRQQLISYFLQFSSHKPAYAQLRFIDANGMEVVRINNQGVPVAVPLSGLQNKAQRYYVREAMALGEGEVYISRFDHNMEQGKLQENTPTLRVAARVIDSKGKGLGLVVVNLSGEELVEAVWGRAPIRADSVALVSSHGFSLLRPNAARNRVRFSAENPLVKQSPELWAKVEQAEEGDFVRDEHFYAFATLQIEQARGNQHWKIFTLHGDSGVQLATLQFVYNNVPLYGLLALVLAGAALLNALHRRRHRLVEANNAYERTFRHLLEEIKLAAVTLDESGRVQFCNDHFLQLTGYLRSEIQGQNWVERFVPAPARHQIYQQLTQAFERAIVPPSQHGQIITADGQRLIIAWTATLQQDAAGQVAQLSLVGEDITEQLNAEKALRHLNQAVEQSANTVMITDTDGAITYVNPAFSHLTGYSAAEIKGQSPCLLKSGHTSEEQYRILWRTLMEGGIWQGEFRNRKKNGELYWERAQISPVRDDNGRTLSFIAVKQDITEEKRLQAELEQETRERVRNEQLAAVGRMANMVAHDLRNPLSSIKVGLQMLCRRPDQDSESRELSQISLDQVRHMEGILENLLAYSRPDALKLEWISLNQLLDQVVMGQMRLIQDRNVFIDRDFDPRLPTLNADPVKLRRALENLVINAIDAAQASDSQIARVSLKTRIIFTDHGLKLALEIINNGDTIDPCMCQKVFEPFFTTKAKGTGLGLAIVQRIILQHQGRVRLEPVIAGGTRAWVTLPLSVLGSDCDTPEG